MYIHTDAAATPTGTTARCTGTLIAPNIVLSAGHCLDMQNVAPRPAGANRYRSSDQADWIHPKKWYPTYNRLPDGMQIHVGHDTLNWLDTKNVRYFAKPGYADMVLLLLDGPISPDHAVPAKPLLDASGMDIDWSQQDFRTAGWGSLIAVPPQVPGGPQITPVYPRYRMTLNASGATYRDSAPWPAACRVSNASTRTCGCIPNKICVTTTSARRSVAPGDSGGPLYWTNPEDDQLYVIGDLQNTAETYVVTFGPGGTDSSGLFAPRLGEWIEYKLGRRHDAAWFDQRGSGRNEAGDRMGSAFAVGEFIDTGGSFNSLDVAVGAPGEDYRGSGADAGVVFLFSRRGALFEPSGYLEQSGAGRNEAGDRFGAALASADVIGGANTDLLVGAPGEDYQSSGPNAGVVFLFPGTGTEFGTPVVLKQEPVEASQSGDLFGSAIATGDFNGDGLMDVAIGAPGDSATRRVSGSGSVFIYDGTTTGLALPDVLPHGAGRVSSGDQFGHALATGDFNGDGFDDLAVGAPMRAVSGSAPSGAVVIYHGSAGGLNSVGTLGQAPAGRNEAGDAFGFALASGDFNADGIADLAVGAPGENFDGSGPDAGVVFVFAGSFGAGLTAPTLLTQAPIGRNESGDRFGFALTSADLNGDSFDDLAIGAPGENYRGSGPNAGVFYTALGTQNGLLAAPIHFDQLAGRNEAQDMFGAALIGGHDPGEHSAFLIVGSPGENVEGSGPGAGVMYYIP
ncbi:FG-GAP-like repeat-containing protein [uncultured Tateyamaria sp.]|uniref:FG-GAP-like repeat-containing protein n=1 Tax=Tateyamaria sp. 1078 TaxID=3417464 RepID=UPI00260A00C9|nr:FG-GAP-like repeat-containing protein [uncultured Tateyamaria sp.]